MGNELTSARQEDALFAKIIGDLNKKIQAIGMRGGYKPQTKSYRESMRARLKEGFTVEDFKHIHSVMVAEWGDTERQVYLTPATLYRASKFQGYLNRPPLAEDKKPVPLSMEKIGELWLRTPERHQHLVEPLPREHFENMKAFYQKHNAPEHALQWIDERIETTSLVTSTGDMQTIKEMRQRLKAGNYER